MKSFFALSVLFLSIAAAAEDMQGPPPGNPPEIPQSAYTACAGKAQGDSVTDGQMQGTCEVGPSGQLALRPNGPPPGGAPPNGAPPVESATSSSAQPAYGAN